ncbi:hypothetical protein niasHS_005105 [Heterodera schachtii]|uniref:Superoxide dismutase [Cu-Zn] n=1 Tax=Heterodera schachtii TaxID=97005 RepID=A0ABD2JLP6_HETSC
MLFVVGLYIFLQLLTFSIVNAYNYEQRGYGGYKAAYVPNCLNKRVVQARVFMFRANDNPSIKPLEPIGVIDIAENFYGVTILKGTIRLEPGNHGLHFHQFGDISKACMAAGAHFNPYNVSHGAPNARVRHVGDLGNLAANADGIAVVDIQDRLLKLNGLHSVVGRALVVHEKRDDLGLGANAESLKTGNSGKRVGCGVVGITKEL